eukprot:COSAG02_NODE_2180_length_9587_cov_3.009275_2_plen_177_part_00
MCIRCKCSAGGRYRRISVSVSSGSRNRPLCFFAERVLRGLSALAPTAERRDPLRADRAAGCWLSSVHSSSSARAPAELERLRGIAQGARSDTDATPYRHAHANRKIEVRRFHRKTICKRRKRNHFVIFGSSLENGVILISDGDCSMGRGAGDSTKYRGSSIIFSRDTVLFMIYRYR